MNDLYKDYEKYLSGFEYRKRMCMGKCLERDINDDAYGDVSMYNLYMGYKIEESNEMLKKVAEWYELRRASSGRDPQREIDFCAMRLIRVLHYCGDNLYDDTRDAIKNFFNKYNFESIYK